MFDVLFSEHTLTTALSLATPILLCALGGAVCSQSGNFNISMEAFMLIGAFFGVVGSYYLSSAAAGVLTAVLASVAMALLYGFFLIKLKANEIILGFGFNMLAIALTGWLLEPVFGGSGSFYNPAIPSLGKITIPLIDKIPVLRCLSGHNILVYASWVLVLVLFLLMYRTPLGFRLRALGENPKALVSSGLRTVRYRYLAEIIIGVTCGLAGAFLSVGNLSMFTENMTSGRGYIALSLVVFGRRHPVGVCLAALFMGAANALQFKMQALGVSLPIQFFTGLPYILTVVVLFISAIKKTDTDPAALGKPYIRTMR